MVLAKRLRVGIVFFSLLGFILHLVISFSFPERCIWNSGISFGTFADSNFVAILLVQVVGLALVLNLMRSQVSVVNNAFLNMIVIGAVGNITDRMVHRAVCDYLSVGIGPTFNINDILICAGVFFLILSYLYDAFRN